MTWYPPVPSEGYRLPNHADASVQAFLFLVAGIVRLTRPQVIVEAGTFHGHFAIACTASLRMVQVPHHIWTADLVDYGASALVAQYGLADTVTCSPLDFAEMLTEHLGHQTVDLAFIDSGPTDELPEVLSPDIRWQHYQAVRPYMKRGGLIIVDDTQPEADWAHALDIRKDGVTLMHSRGLTLIQAP